MRVFSVILKKNISGELPMKYENNWDSLNSRPVPEWFADAKFGIFIHWGLYSVPAYAPKGDYAEWYGYSCNLETPEHPSHPKYKEFHRKHYNSRPYYDFINDFTGYRFDASTDEAPAEERVRVGLRPVASASQPLVACGLLPGHGVVQGYAHCQSTGIGGRIWLDKTTICHLPAHRQAYSAGPRCHWTKGEPSLVS